MTQHEVEQPLVAALDWLGVRGDDHRQAMLGVAVHDLTAQAEHQEPAPWRQPELVAVSAAERRTPGLHLGVGLDGGGRAQVVGGQQAHTVADAVVQQQVGKEQQVARRADQPGAAVADRLRAGEKPDMIARTQRVEQTRAQVVHKRRPGDPLHKCRQHVRGARVVREDGTRRVGRRHGEV